MITEDTQLRWVEEREWWLWGAKSYAFNVQNFHGEEYNRDPIPEAKWIELEKQQLTEPIRLGWDGYKGHFVYRFRNRFYRCKDNISPAMFVTALEQKEDRKSKRMDKLRRDSGE